MRKLLIILIVLMSSCELVIDAEVPYIGDKIVTNAVQHPDSVWTVDLTSTKYILDEEYFYPVIAGANVVVTKPDGSTETLMSEPGNFIYRGTTKPEAGKEYSISVKHPGYEGVAGKMKMPQVVKIIDIVWYSSRVDEGEFPFDLTFADPAGENNFYDVSVYLVMSQSYSGPDGEVITQTFRQSAYTFIRDPGITDDEHSDFTDKTFDGKTLTLPFMTYMNSWAGDISKIEVWLTSTSEDLYKYNKTSELQGEVDGDPFAQPVQVFSNMSNGFGIFAGMANDVKVYDAPKN